jgi:alpha-tubulin suppressor-like RCC1 family protein
MSSEVSSSQVAVGLNGASRVAAGDHHVCALERDGTVWCWGGNDVGQLGLGDTVATVTPTQVPGLTGVVDLAAGGSVTCARRNTGELLCWGDDSVGELGNGITGIRPAPVPVSGLSGVRQVSAGGNFTCAVLDGGGAECWGGDADGELGDGLTADRALAGPVPGLSGVQQISAGGYAACALLDGGTVTCWGSDLGGQTQADGGGSTPSMVGAIAGAAAVQTSPSQLAGIPMMSACQNECSDTCTLLNGGSVVCWGDNIDGQLANGGFGTTEQPPGTAVLPAPATQLALGAMHGCALLNDGTVACWGDNTYGQLGDGTYASRAAGARIEGLANVTQVVSGEQHSCALGSGPDGGMFGVWCWGDDSYGQLGDDYCCGSTVPSPDQAQIFGVNGATPVALAAGLYHTCALMSDGTLQCWGDSNDGELGSPYGGGAYPESVSSISTAVAISAGGALTNVNGNFTAHTCALLADATVQCWGSDRYGEIGDGLFGYVATPLGVPLP